MPQFSEQDGPGPRRDVVGYAGLWFVSDPDGDQAHVTNIVVAEGHRRAGIATRLMVALAHEARRRRCVAWTLEVRATSEGAQELYRRFGFAPAGVRKNYYDDGRGQRIDARHERRADRIRNR